MVVLPINRHIFRIRLAFFYYAMMVPFICVLPVSILVVKWRHQVCDGKHSFHWNSFCCCCGNSMK